jgi:hypothetical protein
MKVSQKSVVHWVAKRTAKQHRPARPVLQELPVSSLKHVAGGSSVSTQNPKGNW